ncbi:hypothetical protein BCV71DRAFT_291064 [Rhizopus microsporus]|uniref:Uncharacterized protein n=1 Tax=Rhizopus microsporus TaxID=58291 RepID=A0A1X0S1N9_RHIZD|nr:hypothetical protein BCV71DRAFT_291064 [Rhizopus microsporus]
MRVVYSFCKYVLPIIKYFSTVTGLRSFIWCEKASASCKQLGIYHLGIRSKLFDGLGTVPRIECSDQQDTPHNQKDFLKLFECTSTCLLLDMMKHRCAS